MMNSNGRPEVKDCASIDYHGNCIFPDLVLFEIFLLLPLKSIFRLRCVCKQWCSLLRDPHFHERYSLRSKQFPYSTLVLVGQDEWEGIHFVTSNYNLFRSPSFPIPFVSLNVPRIVGSSNALILIKTLSVVPDISQKYHVCNPFTREWITLPDDPRNNTGLRGIGFISRIKDGIPTYRVVGITVGNFYYCCSKRCSKADVILFTIFSSETCDWEVHKVLLPFTEFANGFYNEDAAVNHMGYIHWVNVFDGFLIACDPYREGPWYRHIMLPRKGKIFDGMDMIVGTCQGNLLCFEMSNSVVENDMFPGWRLFVFNNDYDNARWTLIMNAHNRQLPPLSEALAGKIDLSRSFCPLAFDPYLTDIVYFLHAGYIISFNMKKGWFEDEFVSCPYMGPSWLVKAFTVLVPQCLPVQDEEKQHQSSKEIETGFFQTIGRYVTDAFYQEQILLPPTLFEDQQPCQSKGFMGLFADFL